MAFATYSSHQQHAYYGAQPYDLDDFSDNYGSHHYSNSLQSYPRVSEHNYYNQECVKPATKLQQGLTEKFKEHDISCCGTATFTYEEFMMTVLRFLMI
ncbi:hypothetical protein MKX01_041718 [Papaver californicum]|nr:hypothetical protein MKX01_041718 [Papaver californicum]